MHPTNMWTSYQIDASLRWRHWIYQNTSFTDLLLLLLSLCLLLRKYIQGKFPRSDEIPDAFWYQIPQSRPEQALARQRRADARNIASVLNDQGYDIVIFWGSQSGRAEGIARRLAIALEARFRLKVLAEDLDDYDHVHLDKVASTKLCGFILSTYGDGDPPDNACGFLGAVKSMENQGRKLSNMQYFIFGLGNSNYLQYNQVAKKADAQLQHLGASRCGPFGQGDDAQGQTERDFLDWRPRIEDAIKTLLNVPEFKAEYQPIFEVRESPNIADDDIHWGEPATARARLLQGQLADTSNATAIQVSRIDSLWHSGDRTCLHIELNLGDARKVKYKTGDHLAIWPSNPDDEVKRLLFLLGLDGKEQSPITIYPKDDSSIRSIPVPSPTTFEALFRYYLEICAPLTLDTLLKLTDLAASSDASERLRQVTGTQETFQSEILERHMTLADVLEMASADVARTVPLSFWLENLTPMQPRYYSISSSTAVHPSRMDLTIVVNNPWVDLAGERTVRAGCYGLTTSYLHSLSISMGDNQGCSIALPTHAFSGPRGILDSCKIFGRVRQSNFKLPPKPSTPIIMVGAGTGVAPFRAFMQERARLHQISKQVGKTMLFMGFRRRDLDFVYEDEWSGWQEELGKDSFQYFTAFSRDDHGHRMYVQDSIRHQTKDVLDLLEKNSASRIYICGSARMARGVAETLVDIRKGFKEETECHARVWLKTLRKQGRLLEDVWG